MDHSESGAAAGPTVLAWSTPPAVLVTAWIGAVAGLVWCVLGPSDAAGRLLVGGAAVVLAGAAAYGSLARPRLSADSSGLRIRGLRGARSYPWPAVSRARVLHLRRFGRDVPTLEIEMEIETGVAGDPGERLYVFGRLDLGTDPREVAQALRTLRGTPGHAPG